MKLTLVAGEVLANEGRHQFRTAETEKYAHVTYFFNGGREEPFSGEERLLVPSPKVRTYDLQPEMSSRGVTDAVLDRVQKKDDTLIVVNFAHPDMVGHTGVFDAAVAAVESTDRCIGEIVEVALAKNRMVFITADHGNVEMMVDPATGKPHTAHTTNPVPLICIGPFQGYRLRPKGALCDVMPTVFSALEVPQPAAMSGKNLLVR